MHENAADWFWGKLTQNLGNGDEISFWNGSWLRNKPLVEIFSRLYHLSAMKEGTVREMRRWIDDRWSWEIVWRRALLEMESARLEELHSFLQ